MSALSIHQAHVGISLVAEVVLREAAPGQVAVDDPLQGAQVGQVTADLARPQRPARRAVHRQRLRPPLRRLDAVDDVEGQTGHR
jgi:hypothetical protein